MEKIEDFESVTELKKTNFDMIKKLIIESESKLENMSELEDIELFSHTLNLLDLVTRFIEIGDVDYWKQFGEKILRKTFNKLLGISQERTKIVIERPTEFEFNKELFRKIFNLLDDEMFNIFEKHKYIEESQIKKGKLHLVKEKSYFAYLMKLRNVSYKQIENIFDFEKSFDNLKDIKIVTRNMREFVENINKNFITEDFITKDYFY